MIPGNTPDFCTSDRGAGVHWTKGGHLQTRNADTDELAPQGSHYAQDDVPKGSPAKCPPNNEEALSETTSEKSALAFWANRGKSWSPGPTFGTVFVLHGQH